MRRPCLRGHTSRNPGCPGCKAQPPPRYEPHRHQSLIPDRSTDVPEIETKAGVHICASDAVKAEEVKSLLESFDVWRDRGILPLRPDQRMRIDLVDNWHEGSLAARAYQLANEDRVFLDTQFDEMHLQGRLAWMKMPTPFGCPVFVV